MALNNLGLGFVFTAKDLASGTMRTLKGKLNGLGAQSKATGIAMKAGFAIAASGIVPLLAGLTTLAASFALARGAADFQRQIVDLGNISGATAAELKLLEKAAIDAGIATQFDPSQAAAGLQTLAQQGFDARKSIDLLNPSLQLAAASLGQLTPEEAAGLAAQTIRGFGVPVEELSLALDQLGKSTTTSSLQFRELPLALGIAARGAQVFGADLDEVLIGLGLIRNVIPKTERGATALAVALERMVKPEVQKALLGLGKSVEVVRDGQFRPYLDIIGELAVSLEDMTEAQQGAFLTATFGTEALGGLTAIMSQLRERAQAAGGGAEGMTAAIAALNDESKSAGGTLEKFAEDRLATLAGQFDLVSGSIKTFKLVTGLAFAKVFKPFVSLFLDTFNVILKGFLSLPETVRTATAGFIVAAGVVLTFAGVIGILTGLVIVLLPFMLLLGKILLVITVATLPFIAAMAAVVAAVAAMVFVVRNNIAGFGFAFERAMARIKLVWDALTQLFTKGAFSGAVLEELNKAENVGLKRFVINLFRIGKRIEEFLFGFKAGFMSTLEVLTPVFKDLRLAFIELGKAFGFVSDEAGNLAGQNMDDFAVNGILLGEIMGNVLAAIAKSFTFVIRKITEFVTTMSIARALMVIASKQIEVSFVNMADNIVISVLRAIAAAAKIAAMVPAPLRTTALQGLVDVGTTAATEADVRQRRVNRRQVAAASGPEADQLRSLRAVEARARVEAAQLDAPSGATAIGTNAILQELRSDRTARKQELLEMLKRPVNVTLALDGVKVGEGVANAGRGEQDAAFIPGTPADVT